jgi:lambda family phage tail tape measure protein
MAASAGSLVVSLGLDAAEYTNGLTKAEYQARQFGEKIGTAIRNGAALAVASLATVATSSAAAFAALDNLVKKAGDFQDLAEITGASAEGLASFGVAAGTAGTTVEAVAQASVKLTKNLTGVDDESKAAGAAIKALGLNLKDFKALTPEDQIDAISKALAGFEDGASKTAVATALLGKSGAELLPFLKALEEQGGRQVILTAEQIAQADEYADRQARSRSELSLHAQALATEFVPALIAVQNATGDVIKQLVGANTAQKDFALNLVILDWAERVALALAAAGESAVALAKTLRAVGGSFESVYADSKLLAALTPAGAVKAAISGDSIASLLAERNAKAKEANDRYVDLWNYDGTKATKAIRDAFDTQRNAIKRGADDRNSMAFYMRGGEKQTLKFEGAEAKGKDTSGQEAKAQLAADLDAIKNAQEAVTNGYANQEKVLEALRAAGIRDETSYYEEKSRLAAASADIQEYALQKQIDRMRKEQLSGKDAIDNAKKIADAEAALNKVRENAATTAQVLNIQQEASYKKMEAAILSARQAAQDFFDTTNRGYERSIDGVGQGAKARSFAAGISQIEERYEQQRQAIQSQRAQAQALAGGTLNAQVQQQFDDQIKIYDEFQAKAIASYGSTYKTLDELSKNWATGASEALKNYADEADNTAKLAESSFGDAIKGLEDSLVEFATTGKGSFKSLVDSILKDIARLAIRQQITGPLARAISGAFSGNALSGDADYLRQIGLSGGSGLAITGGSGGDWSWLTNLFSGSRAIGGAVEAGGLYRVNERGPELLDVDGKQFLMMGNQRGNVTANNMLGGSGSDGGVVINNYGSQKVTAERRSDGRTEVTVRELAAGMSDPSNPLSKAIERSFGLQRNR